MLRGSVWWGSARFCPRACRAEVYRTPERTLQNPEEPFLSLKPKPDDGLRRMLKWVIVVLVLTVLFAVAVVELTLRWFSERV